jgi:hypothetical protein
MAMIRHWGLACLECLVGLRLGRLVEIDDDGLPCGPHFQGFRVSERDTWIGDNELRSAVEAFHIKHLGHELGIVDSDKVLEWLEDTEIGDEPFRWIEDPTNELDGVYVAELTNLATALLAARLGIREA